MNVNVGKQGYVQVSTTYNSQHMLKQNMHNVLTSTARN